MMTSGERRALVARLEEKERASPRGYRLRLALLAGLGFAVLGGSAAFAAKDAKAVGADVFITGDITHHQAHDILALGIPCISAGHYETEKVVLRPWIDRLQKVTDDVQYQLAHADASPYTRRLEE